MFVMRPPVRLDVFGEAIRFRLCQMALGRQALKTQPVQERIQPFRRHFIFRHRDPHARIGRLNRDHGRKLRHPGGLDKLESMPDFLFIGACLPGWSGVVWPVGGVDDDPASGGEAGRQFIASVLARQFILCAPGLWHCVCIALRLFANNHFGEVG